MFHPGNAKERGVGAPLKIADKKKISRYKMCHLYCKNCENSALNKGGPPVLQLRLKNGGNMFGMSNQVSYIYKPGVIGVFSSARSQEVWI